MHDGQLLGRVTISAGIATFPHHAMERDALIGLADQALYGSKQKGRNCTTAAPETAGLTHLLETAARFDAMAPKAGTG